MALEYKKNFLKITKSFISRDESATLATQLIVDESGEYMGELEVSRDRKLGIPLRKRPTEIILYKNRDLVDADIRIKTEGRYRTLRGALRAERKQIAFALEDLLG
jgi:hypothetical protein